MNKGKIVSIEDRIPNFKKARKKKANRRLISYLSIFFLLIAVVIYLQSPLSNVREISVVGNTLLSEEEVIRKSGLTEESNIWTIKKSKVIAAIQSDPAVKSIEVEKSWLGKVAITIREHDLVGYINKDAIYYPVLGNGTTLGEIPLVGNAPLLLEFMDDDYFYEMVQELQLLPKNVLDLISEIYWQPQEENQYKILLYMNDGFLVNGTIRNFAEKMQIYPSIAEQLEPNSEGMIHIGVGAYFEEFNNEEEVSE